MSLVSKIGGIIFFFMFISMILFVLFGQITVRKLRKNPKTKHELGLEFSSGWDIINVAQALSLPKVVIRRMKKSPLYAVLQADDEILHKKYNKFRGDFPQVIDILDN